MMFIDFGNHKDSFEQYWENQVSSDGQRSFSIFLDLPIGFCLMYKGEPATLYSLVPYNKDRLFSNENMAVNPSQMFNGRKTSLTLSPPEILKKLRWEKLNIAIAESLARFCDFSEVVI